MQNLRLFKNNLAFAATEGSEETDGSCNVATSLCTATLQDLIPLPDPSAVRCLAELKRKLRRARVPYVPPLSSIDDIVMFNMRMRIRRPPNSAILYSRTCCSLARDERSPKMESRRYVEYLEARRTRNSRSPPTILLSQYSFLQRIA